MHVAQESEAVDTLPVLETEARHVPVARLQIEYHAALEVFRLLLAMRHALRRDPFAAPPDIRHRAGARIDGGQGNAGAQKWKLRLDQPFAQSGEQRIEIVMRGRELQNPIDEIVSGGPGHPQPFHRMHQRFIPQGTGTRQSRGWNRLVGNRHARHHVNPALLTPRRGGAPNFGDFHRRLNTMTHSDAPGVMTGDPLIESDRVEGTSVYGPDGNHIGSIKRLMIEKMTGKVTYVVMSFGGFLGIGEEEHTIPWNKLDYDTSLGGYRTDITEEQLRGAPTFYREDDYRWSDRNRERELHDYWKTPYYWGI